MQENRNFEEFKKDQLNAIEKNKQIIEVIKKAFYNLDKFENKVLNARFLTIFDKYENIYINMHTTSEHYKYFDIGFYYTHISQSVEFAINNGRINAVKTKEMFLQSIANIEESNNKHLQSIKEYKKACKDFEKIEKLIIDYNNKYTWFVRRNFETYRQLNAN